MQVEDRTGDVPGVVPALRRTSLEDTYDYDAFGSLIHQAGSTPNAYLYCGEQLDPALGFYYLRARYMNPASGRFWSIDGFEGISTDPISLHKYIYASADPVNRLDPSGYTSATESAGTVTVHSIEETSAAEITATLARIAHATRLRYFSRLARGLGALALAATISQSGDNSPDPTEVGEDITIPRILYHYTPYPNMQSIFDSMRFDPSIEGVRDARHGSGQYLTDVAPFEAETGTKADLSRAFYNNPNGWRRFGDVPIWYVAIDVQGLPIVRVAPTYTQQYGNKWFYLNPTDLPLPLEGRIIDIGEVHFQPEGS